MTEHAITLLLCDNRQPLDAPILSSDSIVGLPMKRERMRNFAAVHDIQIDAEIVLELEKGVDMEFVVDAAVEKVQSIGAAKILCPDAHGLNDAGILQALETRLARLGKALTTV